MQIRELSIPDSYEITPVQHSDDRGVFLEWYRFDVLENAIGHSLDLRQANTSVSGKGVLRGVHFATIPRGQAKYVTVAHGAVLDFIIDIRVGSPTFGAWDSVLLDSVDRRAVYLAEGLGHAFLALTEGATVSYLVSDVYRAGAEFGISPLDPELGLDLPDLDSLELSQKDREAPTLEQARDQGLLPTWEQARAHYETLGASV